MKLLFVGGMGTAEMLLIAFLMLLLFGGKRLTQMMRGLGHGIREFREEVATPVEGEQKQED